VKPHIITMQVDNAPALESIDEVSRAMRRIYALGVWPIILAFTMGGILGIGCGVGLVLARLFLTAA